MESEGLTIHPDLEDKFTLGIHPEEELLSVIDELCAAIDVTLEEGGAVLVLDIGAGVAAMAAYRKHRIKFAPIDSTVR